MGYAARANPIARARLAGAAGTELADMQRIRELAALIRDEAHLQALLDQAQPGYRDALEARLRPLCLFTARTPPDPFQRPDPDPPDPPPPPAIRPVATFLVDEFGRPLTSGTAHVDVVVPVIPAGTDIRTAMALTETALRDLPLPSIHRPYDPGPTDG